MLNPETGALTTDLSGQKVILGGGTFVIPFVQKLATLDLSARRIPVQIRGAVSGQGIKLNVEGVAIVKVGGNADQIRLAAQRFLSQQQDVEPFTQEVLAGALRSIVGGLTVEQIIRDRAAFAQRVADESENSLTGQGLILDTFQIQDVTDDGTYLADLGRPEAARVGQAAAIAEANARQAAEQARIAAEQEIAISQRALALKQAEIKAETDAAAAQAAAAGPARPGRARPGDPHRAGEGRRPPGGADRAQARDRGAQARRRGALQARAGGRGQPDGGDRRRRGPQGGHDRERPRRKAQEARLSGEAEKSRRAALAEAEAIEGERRGEAEQARRVAEAEATRAEGEATAAATLAVGQAEAEAMDKRAEAFAHYNDAAVLQMLIEVLPQIAREVAAPIGDIDQLTVVSTDGAGALPKQVNDNVVADPVDAQDLHRSRPRGRHQAGGRRGGSSAGRPRHDRLTLNLLTPGPETVAARQGPAYGERAGEHQAQDQRHLGAPLDGVEVGGVTTVEGSRHQCDPGGDGDERGGDPPRATRVRAHPGEHQQERVHRQRDRQPARGADGVEPGGAEPGADGERGAEQGHGGQAQDGVREDGGSGHAPTTPPAT